MSVSNTECKHNFGLFTRKLNRVPLMDPKQPLVCYLFFLHLPHFLIQKSYNCTVFPSEMSRNIKYENIFKSP